MVERLSQYMKCNGVGKRSAQWTSDWMGVGSISFQALDQQKNAESKRNEICYNHQQSW